jgi:hypothetical protein
VQAVRRRLLGDRLRQLRVFARLGLRRLGTRRGFVEGALFFDLLLAGAEDRGEALLVARFGGLLSGPYVVSITFWRVLATAASAWSYFFNAALSCVRQFRR